MICVPYLAIKALHTLAKEGQQHFPVASKILKSEFYVDDALSGGKISAHVVNKLKEASALLKIAGFPLRKFSSNSKESLAALTQHDSPNISLNNETNELGLVWHTQSDHIRFKINFDFRKSVLTKR